MRRKNLIALLAILMLAISITAPMALAKKDVNPGKHLGKDKEKPDKPDDPDDPEVEPLEEPEIEDEEGGRADTPAAKNGLTKGKSPVVHLYLYEKTPNGEWPIVEDGAWGKITILTHKDKFIFNGHGLDEYVDYSLINYAQDQDWDEYNPEAVPDEAWPLPDTFIGEGTANAEGNVHIKGEWDSEYEGKIWLVLSNDFDIEVEVPEDITDLDAWNPTEYLFEYDLLRDYIRTAH